MSQVVTNSTLIARVKRTILRHRMFEGARRIGVAVSGGADSVCLLLILRDLGFDTAVLHVNHLLRAEESERDEAVVRELAARLDVPLHLHRLDVKALGGNLEEEARGVRYNFYRESIASRAVDCVATGHTLSDQAETVLFRMMRGAHLPGLAAIHPVAPGPVLRPLIDISRADVEQYLTERNEPWREDSSNVDLMFDRNRIRHTLMPELKRDWNPEIERALGQLATLAFDEERFWTEWISQYAANFLQIRGNIVLATASKLADQPIAIARRLVRRAIECVRGDLHAIDFAHVEAILDLARQREGDGRLQAPQVDVYRSFDWIRFAPLATGDRLAERNQETACIVPGIASLPVAQVTVDLQVIEKSDSSNGREAAVENAKVKEYELDWDRILELGDEVRLRTWKPGDQYRPAEGSARKLKTMFQESRIPLWERGTWPILTVGSSIVWAREFGPAAEVAAREGSRRVLLVREQRPGAK